MEYKITDKFSKEVINELLKIEEKSLTPENVIENARRKDSPLHDLFEWEDSIAAEKWRLAQARIIINEVKVVIDSKEYYAFESVSVCLPTNNGSSTTETTEVVREYKPIVEILNDEDLRKQVIKSALNHLAYWEKQNEKYSELTPIIKSANKVRKKLEKQWQKNK